MYAVVKTGGKQYRVAPGDQITVDRLPGDVGSDVSLPTVLVVGKRGGVTAGPETSKQEVPATIVDHVKGKKVRVFNYKNKTRSHKRRGHRQHQSTLLIGEF